MGINGNSLLLSPQKTQPSSSLPVFSSLLSQSVALVEIIRFKADTLR